MNQEPKPLKRVLSILETIVSANRPLSTYDLKILTQLPSATIHRYCKFLCNMGYVFKDSSSSNYFVGTHFINLAQKTLANKLMYVDHRIVLQQLQEETKETCNIAYLDGNYVRYLDRIETNWPHRISFDLNSKLPLHCTASGKLFLAYFRGKQQSMYLNNSHLKAYTKNTVTDIRVLEKELKKCKKQNYAISNEEFIPQLMGISVPIFDSLQRIFATLSVQAPSTRLSVKDLQDFLPIIREKAKILQNSSILNENYEGT